MKAVTLTAHHDAGVLSIQDVPDPQPGPDEILIDVRAAGVNPVDLGPVPRQSPVLGREVAGVVVARGPEVTGFVVGDEVYACTEGAYAERATVPERDAALKPAALSFTEAAAVPLAALTALQALRAAGTGEGDVVLVEGATGGVGHFAVQIARALGAERVLGTAPDGDQDFLRELGAEPADDLREPVDVALDLQGGAATTRALRAVKDPARAVSIVDSTVVAGGGQFVLPRGGQFVTPRGDAPEQSRGDALEQSRGDSMEVPQGEAAELRWLADLADQGLLRVSLHRELPLTEVADAHRLVGSGHVRGKVVLTP